MGLSRQENWGGLPFSSPGDLPDPGIEPNPPASPVLAGGFFLPRSHLGSSSRIREDLNNTIGWLRSIVLLYQSARWFFLLPLKLGKHFSSSSITGWSQTLNRTGPRHTCSNQSKQRLQLYVTTCWRGKLFIQDCYTGKLSFSLEHTRDSVEQIHPLLCWTANCSSSFVLGLREVRTLHQHICTSQRQYSGRKE